MEAYAIALYLFIGFLTFLFLLREYKKAGTTFQRNLKDENLPNSRMFYAVGLVLLWPLFWLLIIFKPKI